MKAIIVDDELLARQRVANLLKKTDISVIDQCSSGREAISAVHKWEPDILFLDIQMKDMSGFDVLKSIDHSRKPIVVFISAHDKYALKAFDYEAFDFIRKPYKEERLYKTVEKIESTQKLERDLNYRIQHLLDLHQNRKVEENLNRIPIKQGNRTSLVNIPEINYVIASGYYAEIFTDEKKHLVRESLSNLISNLDQNTFIRIHRSAIVNIDSIKEIIHSDYAEIDVKMKDNRVIRISKSKKKDFLNKLGILK